MITEEDSSQGEYDLTEFSKEKLRHLVDQCYKTEMPDWEFYLTINGLNFFLKSTAGIHQGDNLLMDLVCTYQKKGNYDYGLEEVKLYKKFTQYLRSPKWKRICEIILQRDNYSCTRCDSKENVNCYHIHYDREILFNEAQHLDQLATLCRACYKKTHFPIKGNANFD